jgi:hypothetical protein
MMQDDKLGVFHLDSPSLAGDIGAFLGHRVGEDLEMPAIGLRKWKAKQVQFRSAMRKGMKALKSR